MSHETHRIEGETEARASNTSRVSLIFSWADGLRAVSLQEGSGIVVGRSEPAQVILADRSLSRAHARISLHEGRVHVEDLASTNGTQVNGQRIREAFVDEGDVATLGAVELQVGARAVRRSSARTLLSHAAWMRALEDELVRARVFGRTVTVLAIHQTAVHAFESVHERLRPVDRACAYAPERSLVMLPEIGPRDACEHVTRLAGVGGQTQSLGYACFPSDAGSAESLVSLATDAGRRGTPTGAPTPADLSAEREVSTEPVIASPSMIRLYELIARVARTPMPVLILGETGSGKELVARALHAKGPRARSPFKALNCATLPGTLIESVLFGHERGAFTGADRRSAGIFEQAQDGTVFLDEVGELSAQAQAALLRVLEQHTIVRVGGTQEVPVAARVVAATHRDLAAMVRAGTFREDLMFRLDALTLRVPALRERREEIPLLAAAFLAGACRRWRVAPRSFADEALAAMQDFAWPGNVRQLRNVVERAVALSDGAQIALEDLPEQLLEEASDASGPTATLDVCADPAPFGSFADRVRAFEVGLIRSALDEVNGNQASAARLLRIPRRTLAHKVHGYGLHPRSRS